MAIQHLRINNLRNITNVEINPYKGLNIIYGENASGKTSLLEAIYLLGRGKSFRDSHTIPLIQKGESSLNVFAKIKYRDQTGSIGISKSARGTSAKINGHNINKMSQLAETLPIQIITPNSHEILERGAFIRRRFFDWTVFHVEHEYQKSVARYQRALSQRNAALKFNPDDVSLWDRELIQLGERINEVRESLFEEFKSIFDQEVRSLLEIDKIVIKWYRGWKPQISLKQSLSDTIKEDKKRGFTHTGPHKADIWIFFDDLPIIKRASRGQQKMIVLALYLAQARLVKEKRQVLPILLMDDFASELDKTNREMTIQKITELGCQAFVTGTDIYINRKNTNHGLFHVEHGLVYEEGV